MIFTCFSNIWIFWYFLLDSATMLLIKYKQYPHTNEIKNHSKTDFTTAAPRITGRLSGLKNKLLETKRKNK